MPSCDWSVYMWALICACYVRVPVLLREALATEAFATAAGGSTTTSQWRLPCSANGDKRCQGDTILGPTGLADDGDLCQQAGQAASTSDEGSHVEDSKICPPTCATAQPSYDAGSCKTTASTLCNCVATVKAAGTRLKTACKPDSSCVGRLAQPTFARSNSHDDCTVNVRSVSRDATADSPHKQLNRKRRRVQPTAENATCFPMNLLPDAHTQVHDAYWISALDEALMKSCDEDTLLTPPKGV